MAGLFEGFFPRFVEKSSNPIIEPLNLILKTLARRVLLHDGLDTARNLARFVEIVGNDNPTVPYVRIEVSIVFGDDYAVVCPCVR